MNYKINLGVWNGIFCVPCAVVDKYIKLAGESELKILLYLLRHGGESFSCERISEEIFLSPERVEEGINFWKQRGLFEADKAGDLIPVREKEEAGVKTYAQTDIIKAEEEHKSIVKKIELTRTPDFPPVEIAKTVRGSDKADYLFKHCEALYGRPLKYNEQNTLMIILEDACLPVEAALILVDYCFSISKNKPAYMRSTALEWVEAGVTTIESAEKRVEELKKLNEKKIPTFGICLGHQLLALSKGAKTKKLKFGHRGANQPVKDLTSGRTYITSQNHGYAVVASSLPETAKVLFVNANDRTCEGVEYTDAPAFSVQFHPEACGGPHDTGYLFDRFMSLVGGKKNA